MDKKEQTRLRVQKHRARKSVTQNLVTHPQNVTQNVTQDLNYERPVLSLYNPEGLAHWLVDKKHERLERILESMPKNLLPFTYLCGVPLDKVKELL